MGNTAATRLLRVAGGGKREAPLAGDGRVRFLPRRVGWHGVPEGAHALTAS